MLNEKQLMWSKALDVVTEQDQLTFTPCSSECLPVYKADEWGTRDFLSILYCTLSN